MKKIILASLLIPIAGSITGCGSKGDSSSGGGGSKPGKTTEPNTPENPAPGTVSDVAGFLVKLTGDTAPLFSMHKGISTFSEPCKAKLGEQVNCFVESEEQNFAYHKISLHYHVPKDMCDYVAVTPFYFVNRLTKWQGGQTLTTYVDKNGRFGGHIDANNLVDQDIGCYTEKNTPVCCFGKYNWIKYTWDQTAGGWNAPTNEEIEVFANQCVGGPGTLTQPKSYWGIPVRTYEWISETGKSAIYDIAPSQESVASSSGIAWNVNFSKPADHTYGNTPNDDTGFPWAMQYDAYISSPGTLILGEPYYRIGCYDSAWETKAEILIQLRDWNTKSAYEARETAPNNYHETGFESTPFGTKPINDLFNWKDLEAGTTNAVRRLPDFYIQPKS